MSEKKNFQCACEGRDAKDRFAADDFLAERFIPKAWELKYHTLEQEQGRVLYLTGFCDRCGGFLRSAVGLAKGLSGDCFLDEVYRKMELFRPYEGHRNETGLYHGRIQLRARWYQRQDDLPLADRNKQFLRLFRTEDQSAAADWLHRNHAEEPYISPHRDRKSTLLRAILDMARADGAITEAEAILDYILPNDEEQAWPNKDGFLTDYRFDVVPHLSFGCEGIYLDLYLEGSFDSSDKKRTSIGTFKTLHDDAEACKLMGGLGGTLMYYVNRYVNREIHRYTPKQDLIRELEQKANMKKG